MNGFFGRKVANSTRTQRAVSKLMVTSAMVAVGTFGFVSSANAVDFFETPTNPVIAVGNGAATVSTSGFFNQNLNVNQSTDRVIIDWNTFNIGTGAKVQFYQPNSGSLAVNRVSNDGQFSSINGRLVANGKVMILDPNGVMFGAGSIVDVGAIIASTGNIDDARVMAGDLALQLTNFGTGEIVNNGLINAKDSGLVAFVGPTVKNNGIINAKLGKVSLAAGDLATVDLYGDGLVELGLTGNRSAKFLSENKGAINAVGGKIQMSAATARNIVDSVVNMEGIANVNSVFVKDGKIVLSAGKVKVNKKAVVFGATEINADSADLGTTILGDVTGNSKEVNVLSNKAKIAQGLGAVAVNGTVNVAAGTYNEHLVVDTKGVTLNGANSGIAANGIRGAETIIIPNSPGVTITADNVTVDGLSFTGAAGADGYGIFVDGGDYATLKNNIITDTSQHGIYVLQSTNTKVTNNSIGVLGTLGNIKGDGIRVYYSSGSLIDGNDIRFTAPVASGYGSGILSYFNDDVIISNNNISDTVWDGVKIISGNGYQVLNNEIKNIVRAGVAVDNTINTIISGNNVSSVGMYGIWSESNKKLDIHSNDISDVKQFEGILSRQDSNSDLRLNKIRNVGGSGISIYNASNMEVIDNDISHSSLNGINAIESSVILSLIGNKVSNSGMNGIYVENFNGSSTIFASARLSEEIDPVGLDGLYINNNIISNSGDNGIYVDRATGYVEIKSNTVSDSGNNGVYVVNYSPSYFYYPIFAMTDEESDLVVVERRDGLYINLNEISNSGSVIDSEYSRGYSNGNGIEVVNANGYVEIADNNVSNSGQNGIYVRGYSRMYIPMMETQAQLFRPYPGGNNLELLVSGNSITDSGSNGIYLSSITGDLTVSENGIYNSGTNGILSDDVNQYYGGMYYPARIAISEESETIYDYPVYPVYPDYQLILSGNRIDSSLYNGVALNNTGDYVSIDNNTITNSGQNGIYAYNPSSFYYIDNDMSEGSFAEIAFFDYEEEISNPIELHILGNTIENIGYKSVEREEAISIRETPVGFAAINLNISGDGYAEISGNTLGNNFEYGLYANSGEIDLTGASNIIQNTNIGIGFYPSPKGALDVDSDEYFAYLASQLKLTNDTIGTTDFVDQTDMFVDLGYGAFFAPGYPTILDGNNATYTIGEGVIAPSLNGGVTQQEYDVLEAKINHLIDSQNRGLFFFNILPENQDIDQKDVLRDFFGLIAPGENVGSLTITGLPSIGGAPNTVPTAFNPNAIEPAAGDEETTPTDGEVAAIQPAAGGRTSCWTDASQSLGQGSAVTFNFGSNSSALLEDAANCGSGQGQNL